MKIELRSDTFTLPTPGMREAMFSAPLGDDVFGEDPTVNALEEKMAKLFNKKPRFFVCLGRRQIKLRFRCMSPKVKKLSATNYRISICMKAVVSWRMPGLLLNY